MRVNSDLWDLTRPIEQDASLDIITKKNEEGLELLRHDAAHVLAEAVKELYPEAQITIGPAIDNGFYYDIFREESFSLEDLEKIEARMREIVGRDEPITREVWNRDDAVNFFREIGEEFKWEWVSIPHIYGVPFYVYAYAFGQLLVLALYQQYTVEGESFKPRFQNILAAGGSAAPMDVLNQAGIDISTEEFWQGGFDLLEKRLTDLEASVQS